MKLWYDNYCMPCDHSILREEPNHECPICGDYMQSRSLLTCDCKETIVLDSFTNECPRCGALYNRFGQRLSAVIQWKIEDVYSCFGPK